jgi:predicted phosphodiesterase
MKHFKSEEDGNLNLPNMDEGQYVPPKKDLSVKVPAALKPSVDWDGEEVQVTSEVYSEPVRDWDELLTELGYDPELYEVIEPVKISSWDANAGEGETKRLYSYKVGVRAKRNTQYRDEDYRELVNLIKKHRPMSEKTTGGNSTFVVCLSDWQLGKADGDGTDGTIKRILTMIDGVSERIRELQKSGRKMKTLVIAGIGDMVENCEGHYASQTFTVELNRRQQIRVLRRLLTKAITTWAKMFNEVIVVAVPGNHGENRNASGKAFTTRGDNDDVAAFEMVAEILSSNPEAYGHVRFSLPEDEISMIVESNGKYLGFTHGHVTSNGSDPQKKIKEWWKSQNFSNNPIGYVDILITGHYHHFSIIEHDNDRIHMQCPAMDGGSEWFKDLTGVDSRPGTLTFVIDDTDRPYRDLEII